MNMEGTLRDGHGSGMIFTMPKVFLDTSILIYAMDQHDPDKLSRARELITMAAGRECAGVISTQVLQEFYVAGTKKLGLDHSKDWSLLQ